MDTLYTVYIQRERERERGREREKANVSQSLVQNAQ